MSCFICDDAHITALAAYAVHHRIADVLRVPAVIRCANARRADAEVLALALRGENVASFNARYEGRHQDDIGDFEYQTNVATATRNGAFSPIQIIKAAQCFEYQACEHKGWTDSYARQVIENIIAHAITQLPGYDAAAWGLPELPRARRAG